MKKEFIITSEDRMFEFASRLAKASFEGEFIALFGDLGAGKTAFAKGFCAYFGIKDVSSPTFTIVRHYEGGEVGIDHFDCYRLDSSDELIAMGFEEYLYSRSIVLMEWSDNVIDALPKQRMEIHIYGSGNEPRRVELVSFGKEYDAVMEEVTV